MPILGVVLAVIVLGGCHSNPATGRRQLLLVSADDTAAGSGILWAAHGLGNANQKVIPGVLRAFDAADLTRELWNSRQNADRDNFGNFAKYNTPVIANGKVYVPTFSQQVAVYGLLP